MKILSGSKVTIIGPGAMGCLLAGSLCHYGHPVSILDYREGRAKRLRKRGIQVSGRKTWRVFPEVAIKPEALGPQDWVIVSVKAGQTSNAVRGIDPLIGPETRVLSLQNGIGHESVLSKVVGSRQLALGTTAQGATLLDEGYVRHAGRGRTVLGSASQNPETRQHLVSLAILLSSAGWPSQVVEDIYPYIWRKLIINVGINALTALSGLTNGELLQHRESIYLQNLAVTEAWKLSKKKGINLGLGLEETIEMVRSVCRATSQNRSSMLQDRINARPTEIDYINGAITEWGERLGIATPINRTLTLLVRMNSQLDWQVPTLG
ncbi:MAG: 2-dehydropantoate 2-reductase [Nitrospiraceae bacterium]|nr:2-dehydropantoate 2-reductase [Nitrospiraceae bacterium]